MARFNINSIAFRIWAVVLLFAVGLFITLWFSITAVAESVSDSYRKAAISMVQSAHNIPKLYFEKFKSGEMSDAEARAQAEFIISKMRFDNGNYVFIHSTDGRAIIIPPKPELSGKDLNQLKDSNGVYIVQEIRKQAMNGGGFTDYLWPRPDDKTQLMVKSSYAEYFEPWGWIIGSGINTEAMEAQIAAVRQKTILVSVVILIVAIAVVLLLVRSILGPVKKTVDAMRTLASGGGDLTFRMEEPRLAELQLLVAHFNSFVSHLQILVGKIRDSGQNLSATSSQMASCIETTSFAVDHQQETSLLLQSAVQEVLQGADQIQNSASEILQDVLDASKKAQQGQEVVGRSIKAINNLAENVRHISGDVDQLAVRAGNIDKVLEVIQGIAEQTNLLALNAAIEAARAGEAGRGFAVVADEVRTLAQRTQDSTSEIRSIIEGLQQGANNATVSINDGAENAEQVARDAVNAGDTLAGMTDSVMRIESLNQRIAAAATQQQQVMHRFAAQVNAIHGSSEQVAQDTQETKQVSLQISTVSTRLNDLVSRFHIE